MKVFITYIFSLFILMSTVVPSIALALDYDDDSVCFLIDSNEEEKEGQEKLPKDVDIKLISSSDLGYLLYSHENESTFYNYNIIYTSKPKELKSPPPKSLA